MAAKEKTAAADTTGKTPEQLKQEARTRFVDLGVNRLNNVVKALEVLQKVSDRKTYGWTDAEADKMIAHLDKVVGETKQRFADAKAGKVHKPVKEGFKV